MEISVSLEKPSNIPLAILLGVVLACSNLFKFAGSLLWLVGDGIARIVSSIVRSDRDTE